MPNPTCPMAKMASQCCWTSRLLRRNPDHHILRSFRFCSSTGIAIAAADVLDPSSDPSSTKISSSSSRRLKATYLLYDESNLDVLVRKFKKYSESYRFRCRHRIYEFSVRRLAAAGKFDSIEEIIEHQKQFSDIEKEGFAIRLISLYGKVGMFAHARKLFDGLPHLNCTRTVKSFNALLTAGVDSTEYETVCQIFHDLAAEISVKPDIYSYNILIHASCKAGSLDEALRSLELMKDNGVTPNLVTLNSLLNGFYGANQFASAEKIWDEMQKNGIAPDVISYNAKLRGLVSVGKLAEAVKLVDELRTRGPKPDIFSFNALIKGYCLDGKLEAAKQVYDNLLTNDCAPNRWTFESLIPCVFEKGDLELALKLCKESISRRCSVGVSILQGVVDALVRESKIQEAEELLKIGVKNDHHYSGLKLSPSAK